MSILYREDHRVFSIQTAHASYAFAANSDGALVHLYWGQKLNDLSELEALLPQLAVRNDGSDHHFAYNNRQYEYVAGEAYSYKEQALDAEFEDGTRDAWPVYQSHKISEDGRVLTVTIADAHYPIAVDLEYKTYDGLDLIARRAIIRNTGTGKVLLHKMQSASLWLPAEVPFRLTHFSGNWGMEYQRREEMLPVCRTVIQNNRGNTSGPHAVPFVLLDPYGRTDETSGEVYMLSLHWSGNFKITCENTALGETSISVGVNDERTTVHLNGGECYETPDVTIGFSAKGFAGIREQQYDLLFDHLLPQERAHDEFPVLYNSWYPYEFDIDEEKISGLIDRAADIGIELFVIDDGWMPGRDCCTCGLGDWVTDPKRFPRGLRALSDKAHARGMKFGLWIEPEMVNPNSDLYRAHPDWVLGTAVRPQTKFRQQLVLNMAREDVLQYAIDCLDRIVEEYQLDYVKWDMNRYITDWGWATGTDAQRERLPLSLIENVYRIWAHLNEKYPHLLLENCAHGGARSDYGMVPYTDRINRSDNAIPTDVLLSHEGFTDFMLPKTAGGAGTFSGKTEFPYAFRETLGFTGSMSLGANLLLCSKEELAQYAASIAQFKKERPALQDAYVYHLRSARDSAYTVWQYVRRDRSAFTVFGLCWARHYPYDIMRRRIRLTGLLPDAVYECVTDTIRPNRVGQRFTGNSLMKLGLEIPLVKNFDAARCVFRRVDEE